MIRSHISDLHIPGYLHDTVGSASIIAKEGSLELVREAIDGAGSLYEYAVTHPDSETIRGRRPVHVIPAVGSQRWVVRGLSHGGILAPFTGDRFLSIGVPRPFNELRLSVSLRDLDIPTPTVAAAVVYRSGLIYRGEVARVEVTDADDLASCLFYSELSGPLRSDALSAAGQLLGALHRVGVVHPDLNIRNVLIRWGDEPIGAYILDIEKCRIEERLSQRARRGMLNRFHRSIRKFEGLSGQRLSGDEWDDFLASYALAFSG